MLAESETGERKTWLWVMMKDGRKSRRRGKVGADWYSVT